MMEVAENLCPIWGTNATSQPTNADSTTVNSPRVGGQYIISRSAVKTLENWNVPEKILLTSWLIEQRKLGTAIPKITTFTLDDVKLDRQLSVHERADSLLRYLETQSELLGTVLSFYAMDNTKAEKTEFELLAWTGSRKISEIITLAEYCNDQGWIEHRAIERTGSNKNTLHEIMLRPPGYSHLAALAVKSSRSDRAFVAMWFDDSMNAAYENGIKRAIKSAGYQPIRVDREVHNDKIDDRIISEIKRSKFLVADFTQNKNNARGGVYYEAGFAHGLNMQVIFTCRKDALENIHFDTRQYNHIVWETPEELHEKLTARISATIGDGPNKSV